LIDDYSKYKWVFALGRKSDVPKVVKALILKLINHGKRVLNFKSDQGTEFSKLRPFFDEKGIEFDVSPRYKPAANGMVERFNRTLQETFKTMLEEQKLIGHFGHLRRSALCTF